MRRDARKDVDVGQTGEQRAEGSAQPALMDSNEVAEFLSCSRRTVRRLADSGRMPAPVRLGGLLRWNRQALLDWLAEGCPTCRRRR